MNTKQTFADSRQAAETRPLGYTLSRIINEEEFKQVGGGCDVSGVTVGGTISFSRGKVQADAVSVDADGGGGCKL